ncbi:MAG: hypothetical protein JHC31_06820 [Sulfurihydrogenibium sp.]|nr:hypothetical protein [Sulfurihydrogenibium sp.]
MLKFVSTDEIIKEFIDKVKEKVSTSNEFAIEYKIDAELRNTIVWFSLKTKDYRIYITNALGHIDLYEMERADEGKDASEGNDNFKILGSKRAEYIENFSDIIEELIRELNSKYQYIHREDILKFSNKHMKRET